MSLVIGFSLGTLAIGKTLIEKLEAINKVLRFLNDNYPCYCGDFECPINYFEAVAIVDLVLGDSRV